MGPLLVIFVLLGSALFLLYWLWVYPCSGQPAVDHQQGEATRAAHAAGRVISPPPPEVASAAHGRSKGDEVILYASEIEPGTVVLQVGLCVCWGWGWGWCGGGAGGC